MTTIYLTRHGETEENLAQILQGHLPGTLTPNGIRQADELKAQLKDIRFDAIVCSDLQRAIDTTRIIAQAHAATPVIETTLLRERDWGALTGASIPSIDRSKPFPEDTETVEQMFERAHRFLEWADAKFHGQRVLAVAHGLMNRVILAALEGKTIQDIKPFLNAEYRIINIQERTGNYSSSLDTQATN